MPQSDPSNEHADAVERCRRALFGSDPNSLSNEICDQISDAFIVYEVRRGRGSLVYLNRSFESLTGFAFADLVGKGPGQLLSEDTEPAAVDRIFAGLALGETVRERLVLQHRSGALLNVEVTAFPLGAERRYIGVIYRDVSEIQREHQRFQALVENVADIVAVVDDQLHISYISPAVEHMLGYTPEEFLGKPALGIVDLDQPEELAALADSLDLAPTPQILEVAARHRDGSPRMLEVSVAAPPADSVIQGTILTVRDITERAESAAALRRSEEWAHALVAGASDAVMVTNAKGIIYYVSPSVQQVLGVRPDDLKGTDAFQLIHPDDLADARGAWRELLDEEEEYLLVLLRARYADGTWRSVEVNSRNMLTHPSVKGLVLHIRDVTDQVEAAAALRHSEEWAQAVVRGGSDVVLITDPEGIVLWTSPVAETLLGIDPETLTGESLFDLIHRADRDRARAVLTAELAGEGSAEPDRFRARHADGHLMQLSVLMTDMVDQAAVGGVRVSIRDITARWESEELLASQARALGAVARGAPLDDTLNRLAQLIERRIDEARCAIAVTVEDGSFRVRAAPSVDRESVIALDGLAADSPLVQTIMGAGRMVHTHRRLGRDGHWKPIIEKSAQLSRFTAWTQLITKPGGQAVMGCIIVFLPADRSPDPAEIDLLHQLMNLAAVAIERRNIEAALEHQALHDDLTNLPNRSLLLERISDALARGRRRQSQVAVLFIDLDRFKVINDSLGHAMGDRLLEQVGDRLRAPLRLSDTVGRLGGDEFLVVCEGISGEDEAIEIAERLADQLVMPFALGESEVVVSASIGVALAGDENLTAEGLVRNADMAMYEAKAQGRARYSLFEEHLAVRALERHEIEQSLRTAVEENQFVLHYQPLIQISDGSLQGVEALVRWDRPGKGLITPSAFIPLAEETGLILPIGRWVIEEACQNLGVWARTSSLRMTVNLSSRQLADPTLLDQIATQIDKWALPRDRLCVEVTESVLVDDIEAAVDTLNRLKALGVLIAIDDFGTGYATLEYLRRFDMADYLKIDRSFVEGIDSGGSKDTAIVAGAVVLAKSLDFIVVAEGVETEGQLGVLRGLGCDLAQGFYFSRPIPASALTDLLDSP